MIQSLNPAPLLARALLGVLVTLGALSPFVALADSDISVVPVISGKPAGLDSEVVVLCPDIGERPDVFMGRGGTGLAQGLATAGYRVYLVDPWNTPEASEDGFDAVVSEVLPAALAKVKALASGAPVTFVGHGLCGFLPVAAAADPRGTDLAYRWVALGTRFDWSQLAPRYEEWLGAYVDGTRPLPELVHATWLTGLRPGLGARASSVPTGVPFEKDVETSIFRHFERSLYREPPLAVVEDLLRWHRSGQLQSRKGWVDYRTGFAAVSGPALLLSGMSDPIAPPEDALPALAALPAGLGVTYRLLSRANGHKEEYGHLGMLISRHAAWDVDRSILRWLSGKELP